MGGPFIEIPNQKKQYSTIASPNPLSSSSPSPPPSSVILETNLPYSGKDLAGFLKRATQKINEYKNDKKMPSKVEFTNSDAFWISTLKKSSSSKYRKDFNIYSKLVQLGLGYGDSYILLEDLGLLNEHKNPNLFAPPIELQFSEDLLKSAEDLIKEHQAKDIDMTGREDMTHMTVYTIDDPYTTETDDGISVEEKDGETWFHVHVADPTHYLKPDHVLNLKAMSRSSTMYLPELRAMMFPANLTNSLFSIEPDQNTAVFTVSFRYSSQGHIADYRVRLGLVRRVVKLTYEEVDAMLANQVSTENRPDLAIHVDAIKKIDQYAKLHRECRFGENGAFGINIPVAKVSVDKHKWNKKGVHQDDDQSEPRVDVEMRYDYLSDARQLVAEMMITAGRGVAYYSIENKIPVPFRSQPTSFCPDDIINPLRESSRKKEPSFKDLYKVLPYLARARTVAIVAHHYTLAIPCYTKVTSPIRRYTDMLTHYQVKAHMRGEKIPYQRDVLEKILVGVMSREEEIDNLQDTSERFWSVKFLEQNYVKNRHPLDAVVLQHQDEDGYYQIFLLQTAVRTKIRSPYRILEPGEYVKVRIKDIDYKANRLNVLLSNE